MRISPSDKQLRCRRGPCCVNIRNESAKGQRLIRYSYYFIDEISIHPKPRPIKIAVCYEHNYGVGTFY